MKRTVAVFTVILMLSLTICLLPGCGQKKKDAETKSENQSSTSDSGSRQSSETFQDIFAPKDDENPIGIKNEKKKTESETTSAVTENKNGQNRDLSKFKDKKLIAFTFDDGPYTPVTVSLLDRLDKYDARVTFFVVGNRVDGNTSYSETLKRAYDMGNQIGSHSYAHGDIGKMTSEQLKDDTNKSNSALKKVIGVEPDCIRPPYGTMSDEQKKLVNKHIVLWSVDSLDWKTRNAQSVHDTIMKNAFDGGIVLLHDLYQTSVDGAIMAMEDLQKEGYAFVTVNELAQLRGVDMNNSEKYFQFKP